MGYVKLPKAAIASGVEQFDILYAENIASIKLGSATDVEIIVSYFGAAVHEVKIIPATGTDFVQADVQAVVEAVGLISGGSGMINVMLSQKVSEVTFS